MVIGFMYIEIPCKEQHLSIAAILKEICCSITRIILRGRPKRTDSFSPHLTSALIVGSVRVNKTHELTIEMCLFHNQLDFYMTFTHFDFIVDTFYEAYFLKEMSRLLT